MKILLPNFGELPSDINVSNYFVIKGIHDTYFIPKKPEIVRVADLNKPENRGLFRRNLEYISHIRKLEGEKK